MPQLIFLVERWTTTWLRCGHGNLVYPSIAYLRRDRRPKVKDNTAKIMPMTARILAM